MKNFFLIGILFFIPLYNYAQIKENAGIMPDSYKLNLSVEEVDHIKIPSPSKELIKTEDNDNDKEGTMYYIGRLLPVNLTTDNSGSWEILDNGTRIWRLRLSSSGAKASALHFNYFKLRLNSRLFVYNADHSVILGPFTSEDNPEGWDYSIGVLYGNDITIEYIIPATSVKQINEYKNDNSESDFNIESYSYIYRGEDLFFNLEKATGYGSSGSCQVNVNCSEGNNWRIQQKGIARIYAVEGWQTGYCTGSLVNNTSNDQTPYLLTAAHCGESSTDNNLRQWKFDFNYESSGCSTNSEPSKNSFTGCSKISMGALNRGSDFLLLELSVTSEQLKNANVVYNGWRNSDIGSSSGVSIHHPSGDIKKISTYTESLSSETYNGGYGERGADNAHWQVYWSETTNGKGVTEGGSSGSPIFDEEGYIIGTLSGGSSSCRYPSEIDLYGKFSYHWESNGSDPSSQLKPWLDPDNTGAITCETLDPNASNSFEVNFSVDVTSGCDKLTVKFSNLSTDSDLSWLWDFGDGNTSNLKDPSHTYNFPGEYTVSLTASKDDTAKTEEITDLIIIGETPEISYNATNTNNMQSSDGIITLSVNKGKTPYTYNWSHNNSLNSGIADNLDPGIYTVTVTESNGCFISETINVDYDVSVSVINTEYSIYPNPAYNFLTIKFENELPELIQIVSLLGEIIIQKEIILKETTINISDCNTGIYFLIIKNKNNSQAHKIIIK